MKKPKRETREPSNDITRTFDMFSEEDVETLVQDTMNPIEEDTKKSMSKEEKASTQEEANTSRQQDTKGQRHKEGKTPRQEVKKTSRNKAVTESMSKRDARSVTRGGYVYYPTNMMIRTDLHKALKMIAIEEETSEYIILNKALEIHLKKIKKKLEDGK